MKQISVKSLIYYIYY